MPVRLLPAAPDLIALHASDPARFPALLQSSADAGWDILFALPDARRVYGALDGASFASDLRALECTGPAPEAGLPFGGGWVAYLGYELLTEYEPKVGPSLPDDFPLGALVRVPAAVEVNRASGEAWLFAETDAQLDALAARVAAGGVFDARPVALETLAEDEPTRYTDAVARIKDYIREGDVFQVNISRGWRAELAGDARPADVFAALRRANPAPFSALMDLGDAQIVSSSPERLVEVRDGWINTRPIAGTHPRAADAAEDAALKARLIASTKERAEHVMLVDLERNDLGRVCEPGSVEVSELMEVASYAYVHHIESTVRGRLRAGVHPADVLRALFPGGTITGCPKVRTMQIIRELERDARRAYTGSLGYINRDGTLDFNILIRTIMQQGQTLRFRAGGGIVADSDPARELEETRHKARGLLRALGVALA